MGIGAERRLTTAYRRTLVKTTLTPITESRSAVLSSPKIRILLVDDDVGFVDAASGLLRTAGFDIVTAGGYHAALDALDRETGLDVLVTDVVLDRGNGFALARAARYRNPKLKTIYITGYDVDTSEASGPVLRKPVSVETLSAAIGQLLSDAD